jgi:hypothetical protein
VKENITNKNSVKNVLLCINEECLKLTYSKIKEKFNINHINLITD